MVDQSRKSRPGGRSARVRAAVHKAVAELIQTRGYKAVTVAEIAQRAGVHTTSIYRRWGSLDALLLDEAVSRLDVEAPLPNTGTLRSDLLAYALQAAAVISAPGGFTFLRTVLATTDDFGSHADGPVEKWTRYLAARGAQVQQMLDRASATGERRLQYTDVMDGILAPIYLRFLFRVGGVDEVYLKYLVDRVLTAARGPQGPALPELEEKPRRARRR